MALRTARVPCEEVWWPPHKDAGDSSTALHVLGKLYAANLTRELPRATCRCQGPEHLSQEASGDS